MFAVGKRPISGKTAGRSPGESPYQEASVAAYCSTEVVGIQRPRGLEPPSVSSGPPSASVGIGAVEPAARDRAAEDEVVIAPAVIRADDAHARPGRLRTCGRSRRA